MTREANASAPDRALRRIWLCADDYGMAHGVNRAIRALVAAERLSATSVMTAAPGFDQAEAAALAGAAEGRAAIGLHVTLTAPFSPARASFTPARNDRFLSLAETLAAAALRRFDERELRAEIEQQLDDFEAAFGHPPAFIDGHQHVQLFPQIRDAVLDAAARRAPGAFVRQCGRAGPLARRLRDPKGLLLDALSRAFRRRAAARGIAVNPAFAGTYAFRPKADFAALFPFFLEALPDGAVVMCHPGYVDAELARLDPVTTLRERELAYLAGEAFPRALAAAGAALLRPSAAPRMRTQSVPTS